MPSTSCCLMAAICSAGDKERSPSTKARGSSEKPPSRSCCDLWCLTNLLVNQTRFSGTVIRLSKACNSTCASSSCKDMASSKLHACATSAGSLAPVSGHGGGAERKSSPTPLLRLLLLPPMLSDSAPLPPCKERRAASTADLSPKRTSHPRAPATLKAAPSAPLTMKAGIDGASSPKSPIRNGSMASKLLKTTTAAAPAS
mmetsp:Transcript_96289/g.244673  ORF Transcript_96289/g.244673 Transcript_96289/m.244673 type:complete len:200 (+) Transcript_96289:1495-2094(+)